MRHLFAELSIGSRKDGNHEEKRAHDLAEESFPRLLSMGRGEDSRVRDDHLQQLHHQYHLAVDV